MLNLIIGYTLGILTIYIGIPLLACLKSYMEESTILKTYELQLKQLQIQNKAHDFNVIDYMNQMNQQYVVYEDVDDEECNN